MEKETESTAQPDPLMPESDAPNAQDSAIALYDQLENLTVGLFQPWRLYQLGMILGCVLLAYLLRRFLLPRMRSWLRSRSGWPKWRLRVLVLVSQRLQLIFFVVITWVLVWVMRELTWPSRSHLLALAATLSSAWLLISVANRLIRNVTMRRIVSWGSWIFVTLYLFGLTPATGQLLDSVAVQMGSVRLSALLVLKAIVTIGLLVVAARVITDTVTRRIESISDISPSMKVLSVKFVQLVLYSIAFVLGVQSIGFDMTSLTVLSGAIGLGLGFGLQKVVSNLVSGVILLLDKSIKPGDVISLGETFGWISTLGARYVSVHTRDGREYLIPNEDLITGQVVNWTHTDDLVRLDIDFGVSYDSNPHDVRRIASQAASRVSRVLKNPVPVAHIVAFDDSSINFTLRFWIKDSTEGLTNIRGNVYLALWDALQENNIEIPYPRRNIRILPEVVQPKPLQPDPES